MQYDSIINTGESSTAEFKSSFNQEVIEAVGAFANKNGGIIIIGLKSSSKVLGVQLAEESLQKWLNEIKSKTEPVLVPDIETVKYKGKTLVAITFKESPIKPVAVQGRYFIRHENSVHVMSPTEIGDCTLRTQNSSWDFVLDDSSSMDDISLKKVVQSIQRINQRGYHISKDPLEFLRKNRLLRDGKLTFAAEMLFAKDWHINTAVQMGFFQSPTIIKDKGEAHGDLISQVEEIYEFVKKHINCQVVISDKLENDLVWDYPLKAIRELILNMIVHRDYHSTSESCVKVFDDHIEFFNPGKLMDGLTTDDLNSGNYLSTLRNKAIANHFNMLGEIEKYGSGITRVIGLFQEAGLPTPSIEEICGGIRVTVQKTVSKDTEKDTEKVTENQRKILSTITQDPQASQEKIALIVGINRANVAKNLKKLVEMGLVKRVGPDKGGHWEITSKI
ncbi:putative transcriptional regulator [Fibrobacter succinogenes subsp. succinogenes S85]|uniref:Transcriptional regulator n=1 Tax=Fibrobacter succinogenes (strain ATCC 19169 / S85) TaxID=59374 RepID=A0ABN3YVJ3_FIBSS|nr:RNA-binding domain-containing protein [Fibrobacter succinogenes]ACX74577.1 putative transcriptional regulator [Fibrobacter succinogenes subsp. succinogenes S85]